MKQPKESSTRLWRQVTFTLSSQGRRIFVQFRFPIALYVKHSSFPPIYHTRRNVIVFLGFIYTREIIYSISSIQPKTKQTPCQALSFQKKQKNLVLAQIILKNASDILLKRRPSLS